MTRVNYAMLETVGAAPVHADVVVSAAVADAAPATPPVIDVGAPLLVCTSMSYDRSGRLVEICEITYRSQPGTVSGDARSVDASGAGPVGNRWDQEDTKADYGSFLG